ncbi:hypothetical protein FRC11_002499 [Ceratobasidium sp. 423]|nr:hypothetical protein FRC11_002499 [Ceratobasidium sp. 423]
MRTSLQALRDASSGFSHLSEAARILLECFDSVETAARNQNEYDDLAGELTTLTESLAGLMKAPIAMTKSISSVEIAIKEQAKEIKGRMTRGSAGRLFAARADEEDVMRRYQRIQLLLQQLQADILQVKSEYERLEHSE